MIKKNILFKILLLFTHSLYLYPYEKAVICVPIADLVGQPLSTLYPHKTIEESYNNLPVCWKENPRYACPRLHQLLYNDIVDVVSIENDEVCVQIHHAFYITPSSSIAQTRYWTKAKNIRLLNNLKKMTINISHIPEPINFNITNSNASNIITLIEPYYDPTTQLTFSAGTRFITKKIPTKKNKKIDVFAIDYDHNKEICITIDKRKCYINKTYTQQEHIDNFVSLLKAWAHQKNCFIPYVWGGTSFINTLSCSFSEKTKDLDGNKYSFFEFDNDTTFPKSGFDCSGLVMRAAQICNIPYFYKNTTTIVQNLDTLTPYDTLMNGDLIFIKGHVMIVSDIENNLLIEARSYGHGYGKVHEISLNKVFDEIETYQDLTNAFFNKIPLKRKDIFGAIKDNFDNWKILRILSAYKKIQIESLS